MTLTRDDLTHRYYKDGYGLGPSVTTILDKTIKRGLYDGIPESTMRVARDRGLRVHRRCAELFTGRCVWDEVVADGPLVSQRVAAWLRCVHEHGWSVLEHEVIVYDPVHNVPGTTDALIRDRNGHPIVADLKCGDPAGVEIQLAAYVHALTRGETNKPIPEFYGVPQLITRVCVELRANGSYHRTSFPGYKPGAGYIEDLAVFDACRVVFNTHQELCR